MAGEATDGLMAYDDLSFRERRVCEERDRGIASDSLAGRFDVTPERIEQVETQAREKLAELPLAGERLETFVDRVIRLARSSDRPDLAIRAEALVPFRAARTPLGRLQDKHTYSIVRLDDLFGEPRYRKECSCGWHGSQYRSKFMAECTMDSQRQHEVRYLRAALGFVGLNEATEGTDEEPTR